RLVSIRPLHQPARAVQGLARVLDVADLVGEPVLAPRLRAAGFARVLPPPVDAGTQGGCRGRPVRRPAAVRHRRRLARTRAHQLWLLTGQYSRADGPL